jgi:hypothetical protein
LSSTIFLGTSAFHTRTRMLSSLLVVFRIFSDTYKKVMPKKQVVRKLSDGSVHMKKNLACGGAQQK